MPEVKDSIIAIIAVVVIVVLLIGGMVLADRYRQCQKARAWALEVDTEFASAMRMSMEEYYAQYGASNPVSCTFLGFKL